MYKYFVSYYYEHIYGTGLGRTQITIDKKINNFDIIEELEQTIKNRSDKKITSVIILNYKLLKEE